MKTVTKVLVSTLVAVVLGLAVGAAVAWHDGYRIYAVRTGSMTPTYPTGALVLDAPASSGAPAVGDVITFRVGSGLVTHRVQAVSAAGYTTKGDANPTPDAWTITRSHVVGRVVAGTPDLGYVLVFFHQPTGALTVITSLLAVSLLWGLFFPPDPTVTSPLPTHRPSAREAG
ncbi:signal peptidase I [Cellulomonas sp. P24]|uniref:signal peptidase I n=1 Tax=Cellulomonas sp. P24 TaxID=2885206 RepID=UPI00216B6703|nr:signal peptidase I [Cellulomonas sp. P24]MCR6491870.1 signal peptidase I [Cellulomonas sp. P24]